ncbi:hypothetical protein B7P43_G05276 [Cryptotermes secundus]|uniref:CRAL-TRIO domain-containing protein n=1 Tax=Cryptotermes secundus TaxID=105785 RepID=A0A2J7PUP2_9NEOP|nr:hypothetical protein B7P43_G05276 [Cryptotermes secundus]
MLRKSEEKKLKVRKDDSFMLRYLRASDFRPKEAFEKMVKVYKFKAKHEKYFCSKSPSEYKELLSQNFITILEDRDETGRRLILAKLGDIDTNKTSVMECVRLNDLWMELAMDEEETQKNGIAIILDLGGLPMRLFKFLTPKVTIISALKEEMRPWKKIDIHVVNTSSLLDKLVSIVYPLLGSGIKQHIHFHGQDWTSVHKFIPPEVLPEEYGGYKPQVDFPKMHKYLYDNEDKLMELFSLGYVKS